MTPATPSTETSPFILPKDGLTTYHLGLKAGNEELAQQSALKMMEVLGDQAITSNIMLNKEVGVKSCSIVSSLDVCLMILLPFHSRTIFLTLNLSSLGHQGDSPTNGNRRTPGKDELPEGRFSKLRTCSYWARLYLNS